MRALGVMLAIVILLGTIAAAAAADPPVREYDLGGRHIRVWRLHVVNGFPRQAEVAAGDWVKIEADISVLKAPWEFSSWLPRKDTTVQKREERITLMLMPDRHVDIGWTMWKEGAP